MTVATVQNEQARIAAVRRFNRYYTRQIGVLRKTFLDSPYSLGEARVLYEIASCRAPTASDISRSLDLDPGYLSRVLRNFEKRGLIRKRTSAKDSRQSHLTLTPRGRKSFMPLDARSQRATAAMLAKLAPADQAAFFKIAQYAAEITRIEIEAAGDIARRWRAATCNLIKDARFAERIGAVEKGLPQHPDLARVIAVEAAHRGDPRLLVLHCRARHGTKRWPDT